MNPRDVVLLLVMAVFCYCYAFADSNNLQKTYIVHMDKSVMPSPFSDHQKWYEMSLRAVSKSTDMLYTYNKAMHGFSTRLTIDEAKLLEQQHGILSVQEEAIYELDTTRSPEFLGLERGGMTVPEFSSLGGDVIVGVVDTGVWPGSKSLDDKGFGPIPSRWKGGCESGIGFSISSCNRKLIGANYFSKGYEAEYGPVDEKVESKSPMDDDGHGTHTATTAVGSLVMGASLSGYANGTARGMAPYARLAVYKACWVNGCVDSDLLAAVDKAITDGVDVLSMSIGRLTPFDYARNILAYATFKAVSHGIFVSLPAGNLGPTPTLIKNVAPWIATVGAGTLDRDFPAYVSLGNGKEFAGVSIYSGKPLSGSMLPLVYAGNVSSSKTYGNLCFPGLLPEGSVSGKIVMCETGLISSVEKGVAVKEAGGAGMILANTVELWKDLEVHFHVIPTLSVGKKAGDAIKEYIFSDHNSKATITFEGTKLGIKPSPVVAAFSSRGPNPVTPQILKPDFIAPGVNILAGWTNNIGPSGLSEDTRRVEYNIISGTSMSCPHVSGLAALLKAAHPEWSPAAIRSALMTTAYSMYQNGIEILDVVTGKPATPFDYGAGHVDPVSALDPGLVYDASINDYLDFLCALNYNSTTIKMFSGGNFKCVEGKKYTVGDLNYPSFAVPLRTGSLETIFKYTRTLTNVGTPATYKVSILSKTRAVKIKVEPEELTFTEKNEKKVYTVTFTATSLPLGTTSFGRLAWYGGKYVVSSPLAFTWD